ncbi:6-phosphofructo-2-kinase/fructose-2,6-bisphosphatase 1-like isoform X2 [Orbicella faveolata]|uniref:6-phosphofructo-2-kinase/fructose-2, 6-bisphosphatase 1-like isoform X2 n=1 Tax=Orbicella faveolata TaxID=48498 RepID=UPI0009E23563|nr:6-phosphofructo-2-kinase/fructose-2,6-bisphosphatase 1-like isoform X2 [Orbicella faveolata]
MTAICMLIVLACLELCMLTTYFLHVAGVYFIYKACVLQISTMETINQDVVYKNADTCYPEYYPRFVNAPTVITLVGLPARGKTYMAKKLGRYLNWIGIKTKVFNVGEYRRRAVGSDKLHDFFRVDNTEAQTIRRQCAIACLEDVSKFLSRGGQVAIFDATNTTLERRALIMDFCKTRGFKVFFMESICEDPDIVAANIKVMGHEFLTKEEFKLWEVWVDSPASSLPPQEVKVFSPDYVTVDRDMAVEDFRERIKHYEDAYQSLSLEKEGNLSFIKIINAGEQYLVNNIDGYLQSRVVYFLMNSHIKKRSIYLARHGESEFNVQKRLGGDSDLTVRGEEFSFALARFIEDEKLKDLKVWTSQLKRAVDTAQYLKVVSIERWKALNEMDHGIYDGMTLDEIKKMDPEEHKVIEEHPFNYRYPRGESYSDVCARLEPVIMELERQSNVLVICHEAILQCLMAYFLDHSSGELPNLSIPFHTVFKLTPIAYGCRVERYPLFVTANSAGATSDK